MPLVDDVKERLNIVDVVSEYVPLDKLHTRTPEAPCPFHEERTPSFKLNTERDTWRCFGACNDGGDIFKFVMRIEDVNFRDALDSLCAKAGIERKRGDTGDVKKPNAPDTHSAAVHKVNSTAADYWDKQLWGETGTVAREYLESRGIDRTTAQRWGIGFAPPVSNSLLHYLKSMQTPYKTVESAGLLTKLEQGRLRDMFIDRITYALRDRQGNIVGFAGRAMGDSQAKYINTSETEHFHKSSVVYGLDKAADAISATGRAVIVEGYMDVIAAHAHGFKNVVGCMGTAVTAEQVGAISSILSSAQTSHREIVLCLDNDDAGKSATLSSLGNAMLSLGRAGNPNNNGTHQRGKSIQVRVATTVVSDDGSPKDPDEAIRHDPHAWQASIQGALEGYQFLVEYYSAEGRHDEVLIAVEPLLGDLPASTLSGKRRLEWIAARLAIESSTLEGMLVAIRARRGPLNNRYPTHVRTANTTQQQPVNGRVVDQYLPTEFELVACLVQEESALDYVISLNSAHFQSGELGEVVETRMRCSNLTEVSTCLAAHDELSTLYGRLLEHHIELPYNAGVDRKAAIMQVVSACVSQVKEAYLRRQARQLGGVLGDPDLEENEETKLLDIVKQTNRELGMMTAI